MTSVPVRSADRGRSGWPPSDILILLDVVYGVREL
jgi:hypothetical protein